MFIEEGNMALDWQYVVIVALIGALAQTAWNVWQRRLCAAKHFVRRQNVFHAAHMVHETRKVTENFFRENPEETFSTYRGKLMLAHHAAKYEEYLLAIGMKAGTQGYHDFYWAQLKKLEREGGELRELPSLPPAYSGKHEALGASK